MKTSVFDYLKLRILSFYYEAAMLKERKMPLPRMAILYPTYVCNHRCIGCDYAQLNKTKKSLTDKEFDRIIDELSAIGIKGVEFCGGGEPTLHPYLPKAIDKLVKYKIHFGLLTNGTNLTRELKEKLVDHGSYCRISVEAASPGVFNRYKRPGAVDTSFDDVIKNIKNLISMRDKKRKTTKLQISYKYSIDINNYFDARRAVDLAYKLKVDSIQFKCIRNVASEIKSPDIINTLKKILAKAKKKYPDFRIMDDIEHSRLNRKCWLSPLQFIVDPYGDVYICCYYRHRRDRHRLGNILQQGLQGIWYSQQHWHKIDRIDAEECNKYDCRFHYYNDFMDEVVLKDTGQLYFI
jgi:radical SAM protein with 4Fe4S-binding SPASM domain